MTSWGFTLSAAGGRLPTHLLWSRAPRHRDVSAPVGLSVAPSLQGPGRVGSPGTVRGYICWAEGPWQGLCRGPAAAINGALHACHLCLPTGATSIHGNSGSGHQAPCLTCPVCLLVHPSLLIFLVNAQISGRVFLVFIGRNNCAQKQTVKVGVQREYGAGLR